ncbi:MAG: hypothetical protein HY927_11845 [Elusimicrobia bacterium]|nr:hypothetical protein [Elusimicrobiota bacterium]
MPSRPSSALLLLLLAAPARAGLQTGIAVRESVVSVGSPRLKGPGLPAKAYWISTTHVRPTAAYVAGQWSVDTAVELRLGWNSSGIEGAGASQSAGGPFSRGTTLERLDMTLDPARDADFETRLRVERLKAARSFEHCDIELGRQPVSLGTSRFVGVLDVLAPFPPGDLDATYKPGIDALRLRAPLGDEGEAELIAAAADPWREGAVIARLRRKLGSVDGELVAGKFRRRVFGGLGWEGDLGPLAVWGEAAAFERRLEKESVRSGSRSAALAGVVGADWRVRKNTTLGAGYYRSDFGARRARDLASVALDAPFQEGWAFLGAREYALVTFHAEPHALVRLDVSQLTSLVDGSNLWQPRVTVSAHDNADVSLYAWLAAGKRPDGMIPRSEFGSRADGVGFYGRLFL